MAPEDPSAAPAPLSDVPGLVAEGAQLYNAARYWDAHEAWERAWHALKAAARPDEAELVHALILATAAFENLKRGKPAGFRSQLGKSVAALRANQHAAPAVGVSGAMFLLAALEVLRHATADAPDLRDMGGLPFPPPPINVVGARKTKPP